MFYVGIRSAANDHRAPQTSDNMTEVNTETDSVLAEETHDEIPLTPEQLNHLTII